MKYILISRVIMPPKKTPTAKKARKAAIKASSTGKTRRVMTRASSRNRDVGESFILPSLDPVTGNIVTTANSPVIHVPPHPVTGSSDVVQETMLAILQEQSRSIKSLAKRVETIEKIRARLQPTLLFNLQH